MLSMTGKRCQVYCMSDPTDALRKGLLEGPLKPLNGVACYSGGYLMPTAELHVCHCIALLFQVASILQFTGICKLAVARQ